MPGPIGRSAGPYELLAEIGSGGMGEVWKARDPRLDRIVAIKFSDERFTERFEREARAIAALNHPNIAQIHDVGENYIVMEYVDGERVRGPVDTRKLLDLAVQIADGLAAAHSAGFVHRDLKPDNILVTRQGRVKILDFGLAKAVGASTEGDVTRTIAITNPGTIIGTTDYMSPEQARGEILDQRSDQFSFGLVLYELATGRRAFRRPTAPETLAAIIRDEAEPLPTTVPTVLRWIIERLLAKDRDERYASTRDLLADLRAAGTRLSGVTVAESVPRAKSRATLLVILAAVVLCGVAVAAAVVWLRPSPLATEIKYTPLVTDACRERQPAWSPDGRSIAYVCDVDGIDQVFTRALDSPSSAQITRGAVSVARPFWSPDGARVYFQQGADIWFAGAAGGRPQIFLKNAAYGTFSRDGQRLAFFRRTDGSLYLAKSDGSDARPYRGEGFPKFARTILARFSPDDSKLAILSVTNRSGDDRNLEFWIDATGGGSPVRSTADLRRFTVAQGMFDWLPDNKRILFSSRATDEGESHLFVADGTSGETRSLTAGPLNERDPAISPDGRRVAISVQSSQEAIYEFTLDGKGRPLVEGGRTDFAPAWHPSGKEFAHISDVGGRLVVCFRNESGGSPRTLTISGDKSEHIRRITFAPDGQRLALDSYGKGHRALLVSASGGVPIEVDRVHADTHGGAFSPDGAWMIYTAYADDGAQILKVSTSGGQPVQLARRALPTPGFPVAWSPRGDWIAYPVGDVGGLQLISPDGKTKKTLNVRDRAWAFDAAGKRIYDLRRGDGRRWEMWATDVDSGVAARVAILDAPRDKELFHLSPHPDGKRFLATVETTAADLWTVEGAIAP